LLGRRTKERKVGPIVLTHDGKREKKKDKTCNSFRVNTIHRKSGKKRALLSFARRRKRERFSLAHVQLVSLNVHREGGKSKPIVIS